MTNGMRNTMDEQKERLLNSINRDIRFHSWCHRTKRKLLLPFRKMMPAREIVWADGYGGKFPACPRCGEYVYYADMCCFCGQRLIDGQTVGRVLEKYER